MAAGGRSRIRWLLVFWIFVISVVAFLDRTNVAIAGIDIMKEYRLTNTELGLFSTAFLLGYALSQAPGGWLADWLGPRRVLAGAVVWWGLFTALTAAVPAGTGHALALFAGVRFLLGVGEAVMYPASNQFVARWIPSHERGLANGWIFAGVGVGSGITPPLITAVTLRAGWRWSFWISAALGMVVGIVWWAIARDQPAEHPRVSAAELEEIAAGLTLGGAVPGRAPRPPWRKIFRSRDVLAITLSYFSYGYTAWIFFSWFFIYLARVRGLNLRTSSYYAMLPFLAMAVGCYAGGWLSDVLTRRYGKRVGRCGVAGLGIGLCAVLIAVGARVAGPAAASLVLAGGVGALYLAQSSFWAVTADLAGEFSGTVSGIMNMGAQFGGALTAFLTPMMAERFGWTASFMVAAACCAAGSLLWLVVNPDRRLVRPPEPAWG